MLKTKRYYVSFFMVLMVKKDLLSDKKISKSAGLLAILCAVVYFSAYVGRLSYSANISMVCDFFSVNNGTAGIAGTCLFVSYGVGKVISVWFYACLVFT